WRPRARLLPLVLHGQLRMARRLQPPLRHLLHRLRDPEAHPEAQRALVFRSHAPKSAHLTDHRSPAGRFTAEGAERAEYRKNCYTKTAKIAKRRGLLWDLCALRVEMVWIRYGRLSQAS